MTTLKSKPTQIKINLIYSLINYYHYNTKKKIAMIHIKLLIGIIINKLRNCVQIKKKKKKGEKPCCITMGCTAHCTVAHCAACAAVRLCRSADQRSVDVQRPASSLYSIILWLCIKAKIVSYHSRKEGPKRYYNSKKRVS